MVSSKETSNLEVVNIYNYKMGKRDFNKLTV